MLTPHPYLQCRGLKLGTAIPLPALRALVACYRKNLYFYLTIRRPHELFKIFFCSCLFYLCHVSVVWYICLYVVLFLLCAIWLFTQDVKNNIRTNYWITSDLIFLGRRFFHGMTYSLKMEVSDPSEMFFTCYITRRLIKLLLFLHLTIIFAVVSASHSSFPSTPLFLS